MNKFARIELANGTAIHVPKTCRNCDNPIVWEQDKIICDECSARHNMRRANAQRLREQQERLIQLGQQARRSQS